MTKVLTAVIREAWRPWQFQGGHGAGLGQVWKTSMGRPYLSHGLKDEQFAGCTGEEGGSAGITQSSGEMAWAGASGLG